MRQITLALVAVALTATNCGSQEQESLAEVHEAVWSFHAADTSLNAEAVIDLLWPEFSMLADGQRLSYQQVVSGSRSFMSSLEFFHTEWSDLQVVALGDRHALSTFHFRDSIGTKSGELILSQGPNTFIWERRGTQWRVLFADADHYDLVK